MGIGSDTKPFLVGVTTKWLLRRLDRDPDDFVFHMDATFKLNQVGYPVFVCGISDASRSFHLVAIFIVLQTGEVHPGSPRTSSCVHDRDREAACPTICYG